MKFTNFPTTKYKAIKTKVDGIVFASRSESQMYLILKDKEKRGEISGLLLQPRFTLLDKFEVNGRKFRKLEYIGDFIFFDNKLNRQRVLDCKGMKTPEFKLKEKLFAAKFGMVIEFKV